MYGYSSSTAQQQRTTAIEQRGASESWCYQRALTARVKQVYFVFLAALASAVPEQAQANTIASADNNQQNTPTRPPKQAVGTYHTSEHVLILRACSYHTLIALTCEAGNPSSRPKSIFLQKDVNDAFLWVYILTRRSRCHSGNL